MVTLYIRSNMPLFTSVFVSFSYFLDLSQPYLHIADHVWIILPSATKLRRLCFYRRLSVHRGGVPDQVHPTGSRHPPRTRYTPQDKVHPLLGPGTHPWSRHPPDQVHPWTRYTPQDQVPPRTRCTSWDQVHPPATRYTPGADTSPDQVHPLRSGTPLPEIRPLLWTVRILLECILVS